MKCGQCIAICPNGAIRHAALDASRFVAPRHGRRGGRRRRDDFNWDPPVPLGCDPDGPNAPNGAGMAGFDGMPALFEDEAGRTFMYFASNRTGRHHIYQSEMDSDGAFGPATPVAGLNSMYVDQGPTVRRDGLEVIPGQAPPDPTTKKCPECLSEIPIAARRCGFCTSAVAGK